MSISSSIYVFGRSIYNYIPFKMNYNIIVWIIIAAIFIGLSIYYYKTIVEPKLNKKYISNKEFIPQDDRASKTATLYYFYTTWCPQCKKATPEWKAIQSATSGVVKGVNIVFKEVDCDSDTTTADEFNITGYPTIKLVYDDKTYEYDAKPNKEVLLKFLHEVL